MQVSGKITIFPKEIRKLSDGNEVRNVSTNISTKGEDGRYTSISVEVKFNKEKIPMSKLLKLDEKKCYDLEILEGWLGAREYQNEGCTKLVMYDFVNDGKLTGSKEIQKKPQDKKPNDLPF